MLVWVWMCWYMYQLSTLWGVRKHTHPASNLVWNELTVVCSCERERVTSTLGNGRPPAVPPVQRTQLLLCGFWTIFSRKSKYSENRCIGSVHEGKKLYSNVIIMMKGVPPVQRTQLLLYGFRTIFSRKSKYSGMYSYIVSSTETKKDLVQTASLSQFEPSWSNLSQL